MAFSTSIPFLPSAFFLSKYCLDSELYLIAVRAQSEDLRREYEAIKLNNVKGKDIDNSEYALAKTGFIENVIKE